METHAAQTDLLKSLLDAANLRHRVIAQNIANVNTPGYHRLEVRFEDELARSLKAGGVRPRPQIAEAEGDGYERVDGNNVDIDDEMGRLSKNALLFNAYSQLLANKVGQMRSAITGR
jgi:flagellar basal-body rod protein FlgB